MKQNYPTTRLCVPAEPKIFSPLLAVCSSQIVDEVLEKAISRIRNVLLLWETNKRLKRARFNSKQAFKNRSIFCSAMFVLIFGLALEPVIQPRGTVGVIISIFIRIRPSTLARKIYGFVFIHFRERFQTYTDSVDPIRVLVWTEGLNV